MNKDRVVRETEPARRFVIAQSWWLASELVRRHPQLVIHLMSPGGGSSDVIALFDPRRGEFTSQTRIMLNRAGSLQVHQPVHEERADAMIGSWDEVLAAHDAHQHLRLIETEAGLGHPGKPPKSTSRALAYRFISTVLNTAVNDRSTWDARNEFIDSSGDWWEDTPELNGYLTQFPNALADLADAPPLGLWHEPESHFWAILRDEVPVAIVSIEGRVYRADRRHDLAGEYAIGERRMLPLVTNILGDLFH